MITSGYSGRQPNYTAYVKSFAPSSVSSSTNWTSTSLNNENVLTPANSGANVYIPNNLIVGGSINNPSDFKLKENIEELDLKLSNNLLKITPKQYTYKSDENKKLHYGVIAQELEEYFPNLVTNIICENEGSIEEKKVVNYIELIPILLVKIKDLQNQLDEINEWREKKTR